MMGSLLACQSKDDKSKTIRTRSARGTGGGNIAPTDCRTMPSPNTNGGVGNDGGGWGAIYGGNRLNQSQFNNSIYNFISATDDPNSLGTVTSELNNDTGIRFGGCIRFDSNWNVLNSSSALAMDIVGYNRNSNQYVKYSFDIMGGASGSAYGNRQLTIRFEDQMGWIEFNGTYDNEYFSGDVSYHNNARSGNFYLGQFFILITAFFGC